MTSLTVGVLPDNSRGTGLAPRTRCCRGPPAVLYTTSDHLQVLDRSAQQICRHSRQRNGILAQQLWSSAAWGVPRTNCCSQARHNLSSGERTPCDTYICAHSPTNTVVPVMPAWHTNISLPASAHFLCLGSSSENRWQSRFAGTQALKAAWSHTLW